jgi:hypothetical protein
VLPFGVSICLIGLISSTVSLGLSHRFGIRWTGNLIMAIIDTDYHYLFKIMDVFEHCPAGSVFFEYKDKELQEYVDTGEDKSFS